MYPFQALRVAFEASWRSYTSENPEDWNHYQRDDWYGDLDIEAIRPLSPTLGVTLKFHYTWRTADLGIDREIDFDEEGSSSDGVVTAGVVWNWAS
jgi:hypothetical protein